MKISIITVVKNGMPFLRDAIKSFELQKYINKELIIVYTKSNDGTKEFLDKISNNKKIIIEDKTNNRYNAINLGIKKSTGKIIGLLHADDIFFNNKILSNINKHIIKKKCDIVYGGILFSDRNNLKKIKRIWRPSKFNRNKIILGSVPPHVGMFMKKSVFNNIGYYSKKYTISSDYDFILRMVLSNKFKIESTNTFHNIMRIGGDSTSLKKIFLKIKEDYLIVKKHGLSIFTLLLKILSKTIQITKRKNISNNYINKFY